MKLIDAIDAFYNKALTVNEQGNPSEALAPYLADDFISHGSVDSKNKQQLLGQLDFFWKLIPDLKWNIKEVINSENQTIVRSEATGTPNGDFMGIHTDGSKSFKIMTIDIHTIQGDKIVKTYHLEDWATVFRQLK